MHGPTNVKFWSKTVTR